MLLFSYLTLGFSDVTYGPKEIYELGKVFLGNLCFMGVINLSLLILSICGSCKACIKKKAHHKKAMRAKTYQMPESMKIAKIDVIVEEPEDAEQDSEI